MARQRKTGKELASLLNCSQQSASRRMNGGTCFDLDEIALIADWLHIPLSRFLPPAVPEQVAS